MDILNIDYNLFEEGLTVGEITTLFKGDFFAANRFQQMGMNRELIGFNQNGKYAKYKKQLANELVISLDVELLTGIIIKINTKE